MTTATDTNIRPLPPRYWWLKRLSLAYAGLILLAVLVRVGWEYSANRRLNALIAGYRGAGERVLIEDFQTPTVADEQNAAHFYQQAYLSINIRKDDQEIYNNVTLSSSTSISDRAVFDRIIGENQRAFDLVREARKRDQSDWNIKWKSPLIYMLLPNLNHARELANLLNTRAIYAHLRGNDAAAIESLDDTLHLANTLNNSPAVVSHLVQLGMSSMVARTIIDEIAADLHVSSDTSTDHTPASRKQVQDLIATLLDESAERESFTLGMETERASQIDTARGVSLANLSITGQTVPVSPLEPILERLLGPMFLEDGIWMADASTVHVHATTQPDAPSIPKLPTPLPYGSAQEYIVHSLRVLTYPNLTRAFGNHFLALRERRMAAIRLAARLYEIDHGRLPAKVNALVPDYLPSVPLDPVIGHGALLVYPPAPATAPAGVTPAGSTTRQTGIATPP